MQYGLYVSAAGALANSYQQDVVANNLANAETVAFKRDLALVRARQTQAQENGPRQWTNDLLERLGGGVFALPTATDFSPGSLERTGRTYDVALAGPGFFRVQLDGQVAFTRDGRLRIDEQNRLVMQATDRPLLDVTGKAISLDATEPFQIDERGVISQDGEIVAQLAVVDVSDTDRLRKQGQSLYVATGAVESTPATTPTRQGMLESSGVEPVQELMNLIKAQRAFQQNLSALQIQDQTLGLAVKQVGSLG
jgi:flagellar basal body rod protein FlgG